MGARGQFLELAVVPLVFEPVGVVVVPQDLEHLLSRAEGQAAVVAQIVSKVGGDGGADKVILQELFDAMGGVGAEDAVGLEEENMLLGRQALPEEGAG